MTEGHLLLTALTHARTRTQQADHQIRLLLACARQISIPAHYRLADLATAAGMSIPGIRTAYTNPGVDHAAQLTRGQQHLAVITALLADGQKAREHPGTAA